MPKKVIFVHKQAPGDLIMLSAAIRDLHKAYPGEFETYVDCCTMDIWMHNPFISKIKPDEAEQIVDIKSSLINTSNKCAKHFIHSFKEYIEDQLGVRFPITEFKGDIHLSRDEKCWRNQVAQHHHHQGPFWILMAGGKFDMTSKYYPTEHYQEIVDYFKGKITFVQCGKKDHFHPKLNGVIDLVGKTTPRQFVRLMYHATGVLCPVTYAMHLAAATPLKNNSHRACVVIAGGVESPSWESYPTHKFLSKVGTLPCCSKGGCWRTRCSIIEGQEVPENKMCLLPVEYPTPEEFSYKVKQLRIPKCMVDISPSTVISAIEEYYSNGLLQY